MDRARPFPDAARSIVTLSNPQTPFAESATHRRKALRKALFRLVRGCYSPRRRRKRTVAHAEKPTGATHHPLAGSAAQGPSRRASEAFVTALTGMRPFCERLGLPRFFACYAHSSSVRLDVIATRCAHF